MFKCKFFQSTLIMTNNGDIMAMVEIPPTLLNCEDILKLAGIILLLCLFFSPIMRQLSRQISKLGAYHSKKREGFLERTWKLCVTYAYVLLLLYGFVIVTILSFINLENIQDLGLFICFLGATCLLLISVRILTTTGLIKTSNLENSMGISWRNFRERTFSAMYSFLVIVLLLFFVVFRGYRFLTENGHFLMLETFKDGGASLWQFQ